MTAAVGGRRGTVGQRSGDERHILTSMSGESGNFLRKIFREIDAPRHIDNVRQKTARPADAQVRALAVGGCTASSQVTALHDHPTNPRRVTRQCAGCPKPSTVGRNSHSKIGHLK